MCIFCVFNKRHHTIWWRWIKLSVETMYDKTIVHNIKIANGRHNIFIRFIFEWLNCLSWYINLPQKKRRIKNNASNHTVINRQVRAHAKIGGRFEEKAHTVVLLWTHWVYLIIARDAVLCAFRSVFFFTSSDFQLNYRFYG